MSACVLADVRCAVAHVHAHERACGFPQVARATGVRTTDEKKELNEKIAELQVRARIYFEKK